MITGVRDVYYNVEDMGRAVAFYRDVLGLTLNEESPWWSAFDVGGVRIGLHWLEHHPIPRTPRDDHGAHAGTTLTLAVDDLTAAVARLKAAGVRLLGPPTHNPWGAIAVFEDTEGNVLKLMQPPPDSP